MYRIKGLYHCPVAFHNNFVDKVISGSHFKVEYFCYFPELNIRFKPVGFLFQNLRQILHCIGTVLLADPFPNGLNQ